ncbi:MULTISPECIES: TonB C-terminal domain-containing protein [Sphingomonas]|uniref:Outer membrane biosynthesis protein TonB n=1 Tax=Sphingomonas kyeonggiensis TaxID=1268553 RepID=A0A7W7K0D9_9SPHN|nr:MULTISPECIES: TonB C-terminal domain-containing protein [Sphingomonas]MBB4838362.1 outer membrane biosynthesis protein TonB [Sphingomonas kyeonggiensis]WHU01190.1 cell envelope biogenesis protein TolA [Sphingomonas sp. NIBR02145]
MNRTEGAGLTVALIGHLALFGVLSVGFLATPNPMKLKPTPIEVALVDQVALESTSPTPTSEEPAAKLSPVEAPIEPDSAPPEPAPNPQPIAKPQPAPPKPAPAPDAVKPAPKTPPKAAPAQAPSRPSNRPVAPTGRLDGLLNGINDKPAKSTSVTPPAATVGPEQKAALSAAIIRQIRPHWAPPSGADSDKLRTTVTVRLNEDGSLAGEPRVTAQTGITDSNRAQADLARDRAIRAVKLAAPFKLPPQFYSAWRVIAPVLYEDL